MKRGILLLFVLVAAAFVIAADYVPGEILVFFNDNVEEAQADAMISENGLQWMSFFPKGNETGLKFGLARVPEGQEEIWIAKMSQSILVKRAGRNPANAEVKVEPAPQQQVSLGGDAKGETVEKDVTELDYRDYFIMAIAGVLFVLIIVSVMLRVKRKYGPVEPTAKNHEK